MDSVTQALLGATCSYAAFGKKLGFRAAAVGAVSGFFPDLDVLIQSKDDPLMEIVFHRHFTHSLLFVPIGGALAAWPFFWKRKTSRWPIYWASCIGYLTHAPLDLFTSYGTLLFWPITRHRYALDWVSIVDPIYTLTLIIALAVALIKRRPRAALWGFILTTLYLFTGGIQNHRALKAQSAVAKSRGHAVERGRAMNTLGSSLVWRSAYQYQGRLYVDVIRTSWFSAPQLKTGSSFEAYTRLKLPEGIAPEVRARIEKDFETWRWFADGWVARSISQERGPRTLALGDARYSFKPGGNELMWGVRFNFDSPSRVTERWRDSMPRSEALEPLWRQVIGTDPDLSLILM